MLDGLHVNGKLTLGENIADLGGVKLSYLAFKKSLEGKPAPPKIDGFTAEQRFFLAFAQIWRDKIRPEAERVQVADQPALAAAVSGAGRAVQHAGVLRGVRRHAGAGGCPMEPEAGADLVRRSAATHSGALREALRCTSRLTSHEESVRAADRAAFRYLPRRPLARGMSGCIVESETKQSPRAEYERRLEDRRNRAAQLAWRERLLGNGRFVVFLIGVGMVYPAFGLNLFSGWFLLAPVAVFSVLLYLHEKVTRELRRDGQAAAFYRDGLARLAGAWKGKGRQGQRFLDEKHPSPPISTFSDPVHCSSCSAPPAPAPARRRWPAGCCAPLRPMKSGRGRTLSPSCGRCSICARTSPCSGPTYRSASISMAWPPGARPRRCWRRVGRAGSPSSSAS